MNGKKSPPSIVHCEKPNPTSISPNEKWTYLFSVITAVYSNKDITKHTGSTPIVLLVTTIRKSNSKPNQPITNRPRLL